MFYAAVRRVREVTSPEVSPQGFESAALDRRVARPETLGVGEHPSVDDVGQAALEGAHGFHRGFAGGEAEPSGIPAMPMGLAALTSAHAVTVQR